MPDHHPAAIANVFIGLSASPIETGKLHALVYLAEGWNLALNDAPLAQGDFMATNVGPISARLSDAVSSGGARPGVAPITDAAGVAWTARLSEDENRVIGAVWRQYGSWSRLSLIERLTEEGTPWHRAFARGKPIIARSDIRDHYAALATSFASDEVSSLDDRRRAFADLTVAGLIGGGHTPIAMSDWEIDGDAWSATMRIGSGDPGPATHRVTCTFEPGDVSFTLGSVVLDPDDDTPAPL